MQLLALPLSWHCLINDSGIASLLTRDWSWVLELCASQANLKRRPLYRPEGAVDSWQLICKLRMKPDG